MLPATPAIAAAVATPLDLDRLLREAADLARASRSKATWRAYASDWRDFTAWCALAGLDPLPATPVTVGLYLADQAATRSIATLTRRVSAISVQHRLAAYHLDTRHPAIAAVLAGLRRSKDVAPRQATALTVPLAKRAVATCADRLIDIRDRALILVGLAGGFRRSELVLLDVADVTVSEDGLRILVRRSKADQDGEGEIVGVNRTGSATCPVAAYVTWLGEAGIGEGRVFRSVSRHGRVGASLSDRAVTLIVQSRADRAGLDAGFSGHSLRAGFATSAAAAGVDERTIMRTTRHRSATVLRRYIRDGALFNRNVTSEIGL
ncbi:tyrosine-type recombinase/integrase [Methylobacterium sp. WL122]|nr:tyrosine-type recombinase/integrase [Methylobacterium sp. WL122]